MTAVLGFITKNGVIIATDSQMSDVGAAIKSTTSRKLYQVDFKNDISALVARSGSVMGSDIFHEIFELLAAKTEVIDQHTIRDTAETALKEARNRILSNLRDLPLSKKEKKQDIEGKSHKLLLAYVYKKEYYMYSGESIGASILKVINPPIALGSGRNVALFALDGINTLSLTLKQGVGIASHAIDLCKRIDLYCLGDTQIGILTRNGGVEVFDSEIAKSTDSLLRHVRRKTDAYFFRELKKGFQSFPVPDRYAGERLLKKFNREQRKASKGGSNIVHASESKTTQ